MKKGDEVADVGVKDLQQSFRWLDCFIFFSSLY